MRIRRVVVTAVGLASPAGLGLEAFSAALKAGRSLARTPTLLDVSRFPTPLVCEVPGIESKKLLKSPKDAKVLSRASTVALATTADLERSLSTTLSGDPWTAGFFLGVGMEQGDHRDLVGPVFASTSGGEISVARIASEGMAAMNPLASLKTLPNMALCHIAMRLGESAPKGPNAAYSPFDTAPLDALAAASLSIRTGECELALAGGVESVVTLFGLTTFHRLGVISHDRPPGEGGVLFVLEEAGRAERAGRAVLAEILGTGSCADGSPPGHPESRGALGALSGALKASGLEAGDIDAAVLSGRDGTQPADEAAWESLGGKGGQARLFHPRRVFGEGGAASGALSLAAGVSLVGGGESSRVLVSAAGFGGSYGAAVFSRWRQ